MFTIIFQCTLWSYGVYFGCSYLKTMPKQISNLKKLKAVLNLAKAENSTRVHNAEIIYKGERGAFVISTIIFGGMAAYCSWIAIRVILSLV